MVKTVVLKNQTASDIILDVLGETIPASGQVTFTRYTASDFRNEPVLISGIASGDIIINDGTLDLDAEVGNEYVSNDIINDGDGFWYAKRRRFSVLWNQTAHGFVPGQVIRLNESTNTAVLALSDSFANSATSAIVSEVIDANSFYAGLTGAIVENVDATAVDGGLPLVIGKAYFLSSTIAGQISPNTPIGAGEIVKLIGLAVNTNAFQIFTYAGYENSTGLSASESIKAQAGGTIEPRTAWQPNIINSTTTDPSILTPSNGDRYIVGASAIGVWAGLDNKIVEYVNSTGLWFVTNPILCDIVVDVNNTTIVKYNGVTWDDIATNSFQTLNSDSGSFTALTRSDSMDIVGGAGVSTSIVGDVLTIDTSTTPGDLASITVGFSTVDPPIPLVMTNVIWDLTHTQNDITIIEHDGVNTDRILIKETGLYFLSFSISFDADALEEQISAQILVDDTTIVLGSFRLASEDDEINDLSNAFTSELTAGTYLTLQVMANGAGNALHNSTNFSVTRAKGSKGIKGDTGLVGSGSSMIIQDEGVAIPNTPHTTLNFVGSGVSSVDAGAGVTDITINIPSAADWSAVQVRNSTATAIPLTFTDIAMDTTDIQNNSAIVEHDVVNTDRILIKETGLYLLSFSTSFDADAGEEQIDVRATINDVAVIPGSLRTATEDDEINDLSNVFFANLTAGSFISFQVQANGTGNVLHETSTFTCVRAQGAKGDTGATGSGVNINVQDDGVAVTNTPHSDLNFVGMDATDAGSGVANIQNVFGSNFQKAESLGVTTTTSTTFLNKVTLTTGVLPIGTYRVGLSYGWNHNANTNDFVGELLHDSVRIGEDHRQEPKDSASSSGSFSTTGTDQKYYTNRTFYITTTSAITHTFEFNFRTSAVGIESSVWDTMIEIWRVS